MKKSKNIFLTVMALLTGIPAFAQESEPGLFQSLGNMDSSQMALLVVSAVVLGLIALLLVLLIYLMSFLSTVLGKEAGIGLGAGHWW